MWDGITKNMTSDERVQFTSDKMSFLNLEDGLTLTENYNIHNMSKYFSVVISVPNYPNASHLFNEIEFAIVYLEEILPFEFYMPDRQTQLAEPILAQITPQ